MSGAKTQGEVPDGVSGGVHSEAPSGARDEAPDAARLERRYRRWLRFHPKAFRQEHEAEILGVLMTSAPPHRSRPLPSECADLLVSGLRMRMRPRVPSSDRCTIAAVKLMCFGAIVELATAIVIYLTIGEVRAGITATHPGSAADQWHSQVLGELLPIATWTSVIVAFWLWMAWAYGHGRRWPRVAFTIFFGLDTWSLLAGLSLGSAVYARPDLVIGSILWTVELVVLALMLYGNGKKASDHDAEEGLRP